MEMEQRLSGGELSLDAPVRRRRGQRRARRLRGRARGERRSGGRPTRTCASLPRDRCSAFAEGLGAREQRILEARILAEEPLTLQQLGDEFGSRASACASSRSSSWTTARVPEEQPGRLRVLRAFGGLTASAAPRRGAASGASEGASVAKPSGVTTPRTRQARLRRAPLGAPTRGARTRSGCRASARRRPAAPPAADARSAAAPAA